MSMLRAAAMTKPDLVGSREIADRLNVSIRTVQTWRARGVMPVAEWWISGMPVWRWTVIRKWNARRDRPPVPRRDEMRAPRNIVGTVGQQMDGWQALCNCGWNHREMK